jgi:hypothetical protein
LKRWEEIQRDSILGAVKCGVSQRLNPLWHSFTEMYLETE